MRRFFGSMGGQAVKLFPTKEDLQQQAYDNALTLFVIAFFFLVTWIAMLVRLWKS